MWTCPKCNRIFQREKQQHSCVSVPLVQHFKNKEKATALYDELFEVVKKNIGPCKEISLPCCIHWFGTYDFIALLPKKHKLEVRFSLDKKITNKRIYISVPLSSTSFKNCLYLEKASDIDDELLAWIKASYEMKR